MYLCLLATFQLLDGLVGLVGLVNRILERCPLGTFFGRKLTPVFHTQKVVRWVTTAFYAQCLTYSCWVRTFFVSRNRTFPYIMLFHQLVRISRREVVVLLTQVFGKALFVAKHGAPQV